MIVLDTNVLSALMQDRTDPVVLRWANALPAEAGWTTSITLFEIRFGLERLAAGRRRRVLEESLEGLLAGPLHGRVLPFDEISARAAGTLAAEAERQGRSIEIRDTKIAGIVFARRATLATRNLKHFLETGIDLVDPWARG